MVNLVDNAVKFNRADGEVTVECGPMNQELAAHNSRGYRYRHSHR